MTKLKEKATPVKEKPSTKPRDFKPRTYYLKSPNETVKWYRMQTDDRQGARLTYFDEDKKVSRSLRYASNMVTPFVDEQEEKGGTLIREDIIFEHGLLNTAADEVSKQEFLDKHPGNDKNGGNLFYEHDPEKEAISDVNQIELENKAVTSALTLGVDIMEAIMRPRMGESVYTIDSKSLKRELLIYAKEYPQDYLNDVDSTLLFNRSIAYKALDLGVIKLSTDKRTALWVDSGKSLVDIPYGKDQAEFLANWFTTTEGLEAIDEITKLLK